MRRRLFIVGILLHAGVLAAWAGSLEYGRARATVIRLETAPVDPRDLLRGEYVWLRYKISEIPLGAVVGDADLDHPGRRVYVALRPQGPYHEVVAASLSRDTLPLGPGQLVIVGTTEWHRRGRGVQVTYGIERYYVPEGKGTPPAGKLEAEVAVTGDGRALLNRLFVDGRPYP
ncbi:MAG TPA: GDYXXLXY domain-containing protein [Methylomirabilota bacterium]|nr:GDYXXLXY domain-containing protein [Methylomirabilota bacterium]